MPRFVFPLQAVLEHRQRLEKDKMRAVADLERQRADIQARIRACQGAMASEQDLLRAQLAGAGLDLADVRRQSMAAHALARKLQQEALALAGLHRRLEAARAELIHATTQRKAVARLKERRHEQWSLDQKRKETRELDEIAMATRQTRQDRPEQYQSAVPNPAATEPTHA